LARGCGDDWGVLVDGGDRIYRQRVDPGAAQHGATDRAERGSIYVRAFQPFFKTFLLWVAGILFALGPFTALWFEAERGGWKLLNRALGRDDSH